MSSVTQLFKIVTANDYEGLTRILSSKKSADLNSYKSGQSIISKAIEVRAKECFDIIIDNPTNYLIKDKHSGLNGLSKAVEYFLLAPNASNGYYLQRLLEKGVQVEPHIVSKVMNNPDIFQQLFSKIPNDFNNLEPILYESVLTNNMSVFNLLYQKILDLNLEQSTNNTMHLKLFDNAIKSSNISVIDTIKHHLNWKQYKIQFYNNEYPILYHMIICNNKILFEYFYNLYEKISEEELQQISNIKNVNIIFELFRCMLNDKFLDFLKESLEKIYKLPIKFNDASRCVSKMIEFMVLHNYYNDRMYKIMYWVLSNNKVQTNPWDLIIFEKLDKCFKNSITRFNTTSKNLISYKNMFKKILYLMEYFNYNPIKQIKDKFEDYYGKDDVENWEINKKAFIEQMACTLNVIKKTKRTKKNYVNQVIEV